jgi:Na+-driven multidrug efflux pump
MALTLTARTFAVEFYSVPPDTKLLAKDLLLVNSVVMFFAAFAATNIVGVFRGAGDTKFALFADVISLWCISVPLGIYAGWILKLPTVVVFCLLKIDEPIKTVVCLWRFSTKKWLRNVTS